MRRRNRRGFTLIELMVVITIIGLLASITSVAVMRHLKKAKRDTSMVSMRGIKQAISLYYMEKNTVPQSISELCGPEGSDRLLENETPPLDAWGNEFQYRKIDKRNYDLLCLGADGVEGGEDEDQDILLSDLTKSPGAEEK